MNGLILLLLRTKIGITFCLSVLFLLATTVAVKAGDYTYTTNSDDTLTITKYTGSAGDVVIPSVIEGRAVVIIGDSAFYECTSLTSVTIPNTVTNIRSRAFYSCDSLVSVKIGSGVTDIGIYAFSSCDSLTNVTIPDSVICIEHDAFSLCENLAKVMIGAGVADIRFYAFGWCPSLAAITVDTGNSAYSSVNGVLFNKSQTTLVQYPNRAGSSYTIPNSVTSVGDNAFLACSGLASVTIPNSVNSIEGGAFAYCDHLISVTIPNSVASIRGWAFYECTSLLRAIIGNSVTNIGDKAFAYCYNLMQIYFTGNAPSIIGSEVFVICDNWREGYKTGSITVYYMAGTTGWGTTFGDRPTMQWWDGPQISANGVREDISINRADTLKISVAMNADDHVGVPLDWWAIARANSSFYYLNSLGQWTQFDGNFSNCHPVLQGGLFNLPATEILNARGLQPGSYTFWFAIDYPMDGIFNLGGYILMDSVNVTVQ